MGKSQPKTRFKSLSKGKSWRRHWPLLRDAMYLATTSERKGSWSVRQADPWMHLGASKRSRPAINKRYDVERSTWTGYRNEPPKSTRRGHACLYLAVATNNHNTWLSSVPATKTPVIYYYWLLFLPLLRRTPVTQVLVQTQRKSGNELWLKWNLHDPI